MLFEGSPTCICWGRLGVDNVSKALFLFFRSASVYGVVLPLAVLVRAYPNADVTIASLPARRLQVTCFHDSVVLNTLVAM